MSDMDPCENNDGSLSDISAGGDSVASATSSSPSNNRNSRTSPNCNKCKNHGLTELLRGHKRYCRFRDCTCQPCHLTEERRKVMAAQTRQKRAQLQDERAGVPIGERAPVLPARHLSETVDLSYNHSILEVPRSPPPPVKAVLSKRRYEDTLEDQKQASKKLVEDFGVASTALPFALVIFRTAHGDIDIAKNIILDAQKEILKKSLLRASMVYERPSIFSHGPNYVPEAHSYSLPFTPYRPFSNGGGALSLVHDPSRRTSAPAPTN